jgi:geranylgeranyl pyrophosphate synthase
VIRADATSRTPAPRPRRARAAQAAYDFVQRSDGLAQSRRLAEVHMQIAISTVHAMPGKDEDVKGALVQLCYDVLTRRA